MDFLINLTSLNWNYQTIAATVAIFAYLLVTLLVTLKAKNHPATGLFILANLAVIFWISGFNVFSIVKDRNTALLWGRILELGAIFTGPLYQHLAAKLFKVKLQKNFIEIYYFIGAVFAILDLFTPYFIKGAVAYKYWYSYWFIVPGPVYYIFPLVFGYFLANMVYRLYKYAQENPYQRNQARYFIVGISLASLGGIFYFSGILFILPSFLQFPHDYLTILLPIVTMYNIIHYRLMEIDTVIHRTILWFLTSTLIFLPIGVALHFIRPWLAGLNLMQLTFVITALIYIYIYFYPKVQPKIDHIFRRRKYDYYKVLAEIGQKIGSELELERIASRLFSELKEVLYIRNGLVLIQEPGGGGYIQAAGIGYEQEQKNKGDLTVGYTSKVVQWISQHKKVLEREQIEADSQYENIKDEALPWLNEHKIEVLIPAVMENRVNALIGIGKKENLQAYTMTDIELLEKMGRQIGVTIDNALHHEDIVEKERLAEELKLGREIQQNLLPKAIPSVEGLILQGLMLPAKEIGGDYYDFIVATQRQRKGEGRLGIVIGDVSGKGVAAGLIMATAKATLKGLSQQDLTPKQILLQANNVLFEYTSGQKFMTMLYFQYLERDKTLRYSSAGHEHILVYKASQNLVESVVSGGFMLGMMPDIENFLEERQIQLNPQDKILLYTDGVTEAENKEGDRFGLKRLKEAFERHGSKPADELIQAIKDEVYAFIGTHPQYDDITLVVMEAV